MKLYEYIAKHNGITNTQAREWLSDYGAPAICDEKDPKRYYASATRSAREVMRDFNIPESESAVFDALAKRYATEIIKCYSGYPLWFGIKGINFIWHGEWSDPEIHHAGHCMNVNTIEEFFWENYEEEAREEGSEPDDDAFAAYMRDHEREIKELMLNDGVINW